MLKQSIILPVMIASLVTPVAGYAFENPAVSPNCNIIVNNPKRISFLEENYRPNDKPYRLISRFRTNGQTRGGPARPVPFMETLISSRRKEIRSHMRDTIKGLYFQEAQFTIYFQNGTPVTDKKGFRFEISLGDKIIHSSDLIERNIISNGAFFIVDEDDVFKLALGLETWDSSKTLVVTVRSPTGIAGSAEFTKSSYTAAKDTAISDWPLLEEAYKTGACSKRALN